MLTFILFLLTSNIPLEQNKENFLDFILLAPTELLFFIFITFLFHLFLSFIHYLKFLLFVSLFLLWKLQSRLIVSPQNLASLTQ